MSYVEEMDYVPLSFSYLLEHLNMSGYGVSGMQKSIIYIRSFPIDFKAEFDKDID